MKSDATYCQKLQPNMACNLSKISYSINIRSVDSDFLKLTGEFKTDVINAVLVNPPEPDKIPEFHKVYTDDVLRIFLGGPDTIPGLLQDYGRNVFQIFGLCPR